MGNYNWDWSIVSIYWKAFGSGILNSLFISASAIIIGSILGFILLYFMVFPKYKILKICLGWTVEILLAIPLLVLLVWIYYCMPILFNIKISALQTCIIAMSINLAPFVSETLRAGLDSIPKGYTEAGIALGIPKRKIVRNILIPQVFSEMLPALITQYITLFKLSSLASVIAVNEILHTANNIISETYRPLEVFTVVALIYIVIVIPISKLSRQFEIKDGLTKK